MQNFPKKKQLILNFKYSIKTRSYYFLRIVYIEILYGYGLWCSLDCFMVMTNSTPIGNGFLKLRSMMHPDWFFCHLNFFYYIFICFLNKKFDTANYLHSDDQRAVGDILILVRFARLAAPDSNYSALANSLASPVMI